MQTRIVPAAILFAAFVAPSLAHRTNAQTPASGAIADLVTQGDTCVQRRDYNRALSFYDKADKLSHHTCPECLFREIKVYKTAGDFSDALNCAKKAETEAADNKTEAAHAFLVRATLLAATASKPRDKKFVEAVADVRQALVLDPQESVAHFDLGVLLMKQEQDAQGIEELKVYLASSNPDASTAADARSYIADPRRAREPYAPDFAVTTLENTQLSLASLRGKVVLLDFWGSWCPPCRESIPTIARLHKDFAKKQVEFVGISSDNDENAWRKFVAANHMDWPEYIDLDDHVQQAFSVDSYPTYIVIDRNGIVRFRQSGFDEHMSGIEIGEAIGNALKEKPEAKSAPVSPTASSAPAAATASAPAANQAPAAAGAASPNPQPTWEKPPAQTGQPAAASGAESPGANAKPVFVAGIQAVTPPNGVDLHPYMMAVSSAVKGCWLFAIPQDALEGKQGAVLIQFAINRDGTLAGTPAIAHSSGDDSLDNAAVGAVSAAAPFGALPEDFPGATLELRMLFLYNETSTDEIRLGAPLQQ